MLDAKSEITRLREETVKMLDERDREYNKKTNDLIARHAEQTARLRAKVAKADALADISLRLIDGYGFTADGNDTWREVAAVDLEQLETSLAAYREADT